MPDTVETASDSAIISSIGQSADSSSSNMPAIRKKERDYEGMFEFRKEDINVIIRHLVIGKCNQQNDTKRFQHNSAQYRFLSRLESQNRGYIASWFASVHPVHVYQAHGLYKRR